MKISVSIFQVKIWKTYFLTLVPCRVMQAHSAQLPGDAALGRVILGQDGLCRMTVSSADKPTINHLLKGNCTYRIVQIDTYSLHNYYKDKGMFMCQLHHVYHIWRNCTRSFDAQIVGAQMPQMRVLYP